jgi:hypothetical protein
MNTVLPILLYLFSLWPNRNSNEAKTIAPGKQPEISRDSKGTVRMVFGRNDSIFYSELSPKDKEFSAPIYIAQVSGMHLGLTRGPQIASSARYTMITAMDKEGNIHWYLLDQKSGKPVRQGAVNDQKGSAPEGLMGLASDDEDHFYAVWLDLRQNHQNNIYYASYTPSLGKWSSNRLIYQSPEGHTCECCKPNIAVKGSHIAIQFRNWLSGSRDLYLTQSTNGGKTFSQPQKLGLGTWKLKGCPMDGGGVGIDENNKAITVWQREGNVYACRPGEKEIWVGKGRSCSITGAKGTLMCSYQEGNMVKVKELTSGKETVVGQGSYLSSIALPDHTLLCIWEEDGQIRSKRVAV